MEHLRHISASNRERETEFEQLPILKFNRPFTNAEVTKLVKKAKKKKVQGLTDSYMKFLKIKRTQQCLNRCSIFVSKIALYRKCGGEVLLFHSATVG